MLAAPGQDNQSRPAAQREMAEAKQQLLEENTQKYGRTMSKAQVQDLTEAMNHNFEQAARAEGGKGSQFLQPVRAWNISQGSR